MKHLSIVAVSLLLTLSSFTALSQTRYVTDSLEIMMRSGPSSKNKIVKVLKSGEPITVLEADAGGNHSQVKSASGTTGYVLTRYLSDTPSARNQVKRLQSQLDQLRAKPDELQSRLASTQDDNQTLIEKNISITAKLKSTEAELENIKRVSSDAVGIANKNTKLEAEVQDLLLQLDDIRIQNKSLRDQSAKRWFMLGAGSIAFGLFLGWLLSISKRPKRQSWGS